jgi:hypothetical protein
MLVDISLVFVMVFFVLARMAQVMGYLMARLLLVLIVVD